MNLAFKWMQLSEVVDRHYFLILENKKNVFDRYNDRLQARRIQNWMKDSNKNAGMSGSERGLKTTSEK